MKIFLYVLVFFLVAVLQTTVFSYFAVREVVPNLILVIVLVNALWKGFGEVLPMAIFGGLFLDFFSGHPFGVAVLALLTTALLVNFIAHNILERKNFWVWAIEGLAGIFLYGIFFFCFLKIGSLFHFWLSPVKLGSAFFKEAVLGVLYNFVFLLAGLSFWRKFNYIVSDRSF